MSLGAIVYRAFINIIEDSCYIFVFKIWSYLQIVFLEKPFYKMCKVAQILELIDSQSVA